MTHAHVTLVCGSLKSQPGPSWPLASSQLRRDPKEDALPCSPILLSIHLSLYFCFIPRASPSRRITLEDPHTRGGTGPQAGNRANLSGANARGSGGVPVVRQGGYRVPGFPPNRSGLRVEFPHEILDRLGFFAEMKEAQKYNSHTVGKFRKEKGPTLGYTA